MKQALLASALLATTTTVSLAAGLGLPQPPRLGQPVPDHFAVPGNNALPSLRSAQDAAREAQQLNGGGRVLSVDSATGGWRVKLLKDGNVRMVFVPD